MWDDNPAKPSGCKAVLTLNSEKKNIFTLYFFSTGSVLGQGDYCQHYQKIFPQMIKNMTQESGFNHINSKDKELQSGDPSTSPEHTNHRDSSLTFTPEKLQDTLSNRLRGTPLNNTSTDCEKTFNEDHRKNG